MTRCFRDLRRHFEAYSTVAFDNYPVQDLPGEPCPRDEWPA